MKTETKIQAGLWGCVAAALVACSSSGDNTGTTTNGGQGNGGNPSGNAGAMNSAGMTGSSGETSAAGQHNGGSGAGGDTSSGGQNTGGTNAAGAANGGANDGGTAGAVQGGSAGASDGGTAGQSGADTDGGAMGPSLEDCFAGLRDGTGTYQDATKVSMDNMYRFRMALETADRFGTSGTVPWGPYRFAIETPTATVCITDETALAAAYVGSHHNCDDVFTWTEGGLRYEIAHPDTAVDRPSSLNIYQGQTLIAGPIRLDLETCHVSTGPNGQCSSGGPC